MAGNCQRTTTVASAQKSFKVMKDIKFHANVTVIRLSGRRQSEILAAAKEHNLLEEVNAILAENGGHSPSLSVIYIQSQADETVTSREKSVRSTRQLDASIAIAKHLDKKALWVKGAAVKFICKHCKHEESDHECHCHPLVIENKIEHAVLA